MRTLLISLAVVLAAVFYFVQAAVNGYNREFPAPGPLRAWQVEALPGRVEVTVWGDGFDVPLAPVSTLSQQLTGSFAYRAGLRAVENGAATAGRDLRWLAGQVSRHLPR